MLLRASHTMVNNTAGESRTECSPSRIPPFRLTAYVARSETILGMVGLNPGGTNP